MKAMWKFLSLMTLCSLFVIRVKSELLCHQKGDYCKAKEETVEKVAGNLSGTITLNSIFFLLFVSFCTSLSNETTNNENN